MIGQPALQPRPEVLADEVGNARREGHLETVIADPPSHGILGIVDHGRARSEDLVPSLSGPFRGDGHDGGRSVGEQGIGDDRIGVQPY